MWTEGDKFWYVNGEHHRDGGLPAVEWAIKNGGLTVLTSRNSSKSIAMFAELERISGFTLKRIGSPIRRSEEIEEFKLE